MPEELRHHREVEIAHHEVGEEAAHQSRQPREHVRDDQADDQHVQQVDVLCTMTPSRMFWMIIGGTTPSISITNVAIAT